MHPTARPTALALAALISAAIGVLLAGPGCGSDEAPPACVDSQCPLGQACREGECAALSPPTVTGALGRYTAMALRPDGRRVLATYDSTYKNLVLLEELDTGGLAPRVIDGFRIADHAVVDTDSGRWPSVAVSDETVHLVWYDDDEGALRYAAIGSEGSFERETVDGAGDPDRGAHASLAVAAKGTVHIAYRDRTSRTLRHAQGRAGGPWTATRVEDPSCATDCDYGEYAQLVIIAGRPVITFYDRRLGDLKLAERTEAGSWLITTLDGSDPGSGEDTGDVGRFASAAVAPDNTMAVAYHDTTRGTLRLIFPGSAEPTPIVLDDGVYFEADSQALRNHLVGQHVCLAFQTTGRVVATYLDASRLTLKRATWTATRTQVEDLPDAPAGGHVGCALTEEGTLRLAWGAFTEGAVAFTKLATLDIAEEGP